MRVLRFVGSWVRNLGDFFLGFGYAAVKSDTPEQWRAIVGQPGREGSRIVGMERMSEDETFDAFFDAMTHSERKADPLADAIWQEIQLRNAHPNLSPEMRRSILIRRNMEARSLSDDRD